MAHEIIKFVAVLIIGFEIGLSFDRVTAWVYPDVAAAEVMATTPDPAPPNIDNRGVPMIPEPGEKPGDFNPYNG